MWLDTSNTFDFAADRKYVFVVSLGAIEQHGPYAPLGTDTLIQNELLLRTERLVPTAVFLPTIPMGYSADHSGFLGTVSLRTTTVFAIVEDIVASLQNIASAFLFVSWHGGNKPTIADFIEERSNGARCIALKQITFGDIGTDALVQSLLEGEGDHHAGNTEVSMMLAIDPEATTQPTADSPKQALDFAWDRPVVEVSADGVVDPNPNWVATPEIGEELLELYSTNLARKIVDASSAQ